MCKILIGRNGILFENMFENLKNSTNNFIDLIKQNYLNIFLDMQSRQINEVFGGFL